MSREKKLFLKKLKHVYFCCINVYLNVEPYGDSLASGDNLLLHTPGMLLREN